ncbi:glycosyl hydrolase family 8 [Pontibacter pamirensis]|uniref:glycosyl hydrolase family 8 n=1 Tax=Pontibacter pamirensis TaxID=2562824 RepID=UPI001389FBF0|nr:glycosyl hydrolase family 8 [Pontibacter pamirensis]
MRKPMLYAFSFLWVLCTMAGCGKDEETVELETMVDITVKNAAGSAEANRDVYLFKNPSTEASGRTPANALRKIATNTNGVAKFDLQTIPDLASTGTLHFTVLDGAQNDVLGSVAINYTKGQSVAKELVLQDNSTPDPEPVSAYEYGFMPTTVSHELAMSEYERWKTTQVVPCNGGLRVVAAPANESKVEAIGFGLMLAAYAQDKETFDGIHRFYNSKRTVQAANMMAWSVTCSGVLDPGSATDGDIDVAFALIVASKHWGDTYLDAAKEILQIIRTNLIVQCSVNGENMYILAPGYSNGAWGGCGMTDVMYHTPAFFRVFAEVTGDNVWEQLADDTYKLLENGAHPTTGLVPDWQTASGTPGPGGRAGHFGYDACRAPWKLTLDYLWNGNTKAEEWTTKVSGWANQVGPANIVDGYELDGTPIGTNGLNSSFLGGFTVASMSHSQDRVNRFGTELSKLRDTYWFNINTRVLYLFTLTGNFWNPLDR